MLFFTYGSIPLLSLVFPVNVVFAVEGGEEVKTLLHTWKAGMVGEHCVLMASEYSTPMAVYVLSVIGEVLP